MKKIPLTFAYIVSIIAPLSASAAGVNLQVIQNYSKGIIDIINTILVPVLFAVAFLYFIYGVYKYFILGATDPKQLEEGRMFVLWSVIGFAVILSVWSLVTIVSYTFNLVPGGAPPDYPKL